MVVFLVLAAHASAAVTVSFTGSAPATTTVTMGATSDATTISDSIAHPGDIEITHVASVPTGCSAGTAPATVDCPASEVRVGVAATNPTSLSVRLSSLTNASSTTVNLGSGSGQTLAASGPLSGGLIYTAGAGSTGSTTVDLSGVTGGLPGGVNITTIGSNNTVRLPTTQGNLTVDLGAGPSNTLDFSSDTSDPSPVTFTYSGGRALHTSATATFSGIDRLIGTGGTLADRFVAGVAGFDATLIGGSGANTLDLSGATAGVTVNLATGRVTGAETLNIANFQSAVGSPAGGNTFIAGPGASGTFDGDGSTGNKVDFSDLPSGVTINLSTGIETGPGQTYTLKSIQSAVGSAAGGNTIVAKPGVSGTLNSGGGTGNKVDFSHFTDPVKIDLFNGIETDLTSSQADTITGFQDATTGNANGNTIVAGTGQANETLDAGAGTGNTIDYSHVPNPFTIDLFNDRAIDLQAGSSRVDTITGFHNAVGSPTGNNTIVAGLGNETLDGGGGTNNTVSFAAFSTPVIVDLAAGTETSAGGQHDTLRHFQHATGQAPGITSAAGTTFMTGEPGSFTVTTTGAGTPSLSESGALPHGVTFTDNHDGTATLAGTPAPGTGGTYPVTITASNGVTPAATQTFTISVRQPPAITSASSATFTVGQLGMFAVTATGAPAAALSESGALPAGVSFTDNGDGTGTLTGTPAVGTGGTYPITIKASNGVLPDAAQSFTLTVATPVVPPATPELSGLRIKPHAFRAAATAKSKQGATITYSDTLAAQTTLDVYRKLAGIRQGAKCVAPPRHGHHGKVKRCTRLVRAGSLEHQDSAGVNRLRFNGRLRGRALRPGRYELTATAELAGQASGTISASFTIVPARKRPTA
jgi:hypothetical protein